MKKIHADEFRARAGKKTLVMIFVSEIGSAIPVVTFALLALLIFWLRKMKREAVLLGIAILGAGALTYLLKMTFHRSRPTPYFGMLIPADFSFPSGHSLVVVCSKVPASVLAIWSFAVIMLLLIGFSRIYTKAVNLLFPPQHSNHESILPAGPERAPRAHSSADRFGRCGCMVGQGYR